MTRKKTVKKKVAQKKRDVKKSSRLKKPDHISYSQIQSGRCLLHYKEIYLTGKYKKESDQLTAGHCAHKIIYEYTKNLLEQRIDSDYETMENLINQYFDEYNLSETQYRDVREALIAFGERGIEVERLLAFEIESEIKLPNGGKVKAVIDRINSYNIQSRGSVLEIVDYKNHQNILSQTEIEKDEQLAIYKYIVCKHLYPGFDYVRTGIHHIKYNYAVYSSWQKIDELIKEFDTMEAYLCRQYERLIKSREYPAKRCITCYLYGGCPILLADNCPLFNRQEMKTVGKSNQPAEMVRMMRQAEAVKAAFTDRLKEYIKHHGPIDVDDKWYGYVPVEKYSYDMEQAIEFCHKYQIPLSRFQSFSKTDFEKGLKQYFGGREYRAYEDDLKAIRTYKRATVFKML